MHNLKVASMAMLQKLQQENDSRGTHQRRVSPDGDDNNRFVCHPFVYWHRGLCWTTLSLSMLHVQFGRIPECINLDEKDGNDAQSAPVIDTAHVW